MHCLFESVTQYFTWGLDKDLFYSATITVQNMRFLLVLFPYKHCEIKKDFLDKKKQVKIIYQCVNVVSNRKQD